MMQQGFSRQPPRKLQPTTVPRVARHFRPYLLLVIVIIVLVICSAALSVAIPWFLKIVIDRGINIHPVNLRLVERYTFYTIGAALLSSGVAMGYSYMSTLVGQRIMRDLRDELFDHLQGMSLRFFTATRTGEIQSRLANDVSGVQTVVSDAAVNVLSNVFNILFVVGMMAEMDWRLTLLSVGVVPLFAFAGARIGQYARKLRGESQAQLANVNAIMQETLSVSGALLTKTTGRRHLVHRRFASENESLTNCQVRVQMVQRYFMTLFGLVFTITPALVYWLAADFVAHGDRHLTLGVIVAFTALQGRFFFPLTNLLSTQVDVMSALALFDRIYEYLDMPQDIKNAPDAIAPPVSTIRGEVEFHQVTFRYDPAVERPTLDDISFHVDPGRLVALVGPSGAGKTTLTYLIPRLYDPDEGAVTIDGVDVRKYRLETLGEMVGMVTQETYLVHDTIRENLRYGRPNATDEELVAAAKAASIHEHIASLPDQYDTMVGERGYKLSGGEKQRIAIARAILKDPRILILDEATSALDTRSERAIQAALEPLMKGRTTFAIAHRLSTILAADLILVIDAGQVVERGTHAQLLSLGGLYSRLYQEQFHSGASLEDGGEDDTGDVLGWTVPAAASDGLRGR